MKQMDAKYVRGLDISGYGMSIALGIAVPIPILNADIIQRTAISDDDIYACLIDYSITSKNRSAMAQYTYAQLRSGMIDRKSTRLNSSHQV